ncbi:MAG: hypothetical protein M3Z21_06105 [Pseudomonadota bacterium]|nr:hypothetical protein [Pseudomonadota bacterium]
MGSFLGNVYRGFCPDNGAQVSERNFKRRGKGTVQRLTTGGRRSARAGLAAGLFALAGPALAAGPYGVYPNCVAPAIPIEVQSWWQQITDALPRHIHVAACLPNARDLSGSLVKLGSKPVPITVRIMAFNNPDRFNWVRWSWQSDIKEIKSVNFQCSPTQSNASADGSCTWYVDLTLDPSKSHGGMDELRISANIPDNQFGRRQFPTLNSQVWTPGTKIYRRVPDPIARSWYEGPEYANIQVNYMDFFNGATDLNRTIPRVKGVVPLDIKHDQGSGKVRSTLWLDADFHHFPALHDTAKVGDGVLLYDVSSNFEGIYQWDTRKLANGVHTLSFQTSETNSQGTNTGILKLMFNVQN